MLRSSLTHCVDSSHCQWVTALQSSLLDPQQVINGVHNLFVQYDQLVSSIADTHLNQGLQDLVNYLEVVRTHIARVGL